MILGNFTSLKVDLFLNSCFSVVKITRSQFVRGMCKLIKSSKRKGLLFELRRIRIVYSLFEENYTCNRLMQIPEFHQFFLSDVVIISESGKELNST